MKSALQFFAISLLAAACARPVATVSPSSKTSALQKLSVPQQQQASFRYGAIVDCGSSGTRAHIFRWPNQPAEGQDLASSMEQLKDPTSGRAIIKRLRPGLASLSRQPELASDYMHPIMDFLADNIPAEAHASSQIYFLGTAGLRLLAANAQQQILDDIARDLPRDYPNFGSNHSSGGNLFTRVISGLEEGSYQWLSVNAHAKRLGEQYDLPGRASDFHCQAPRARRFGLLEMGGASVQVSFELSDQVDYQTRRALRGDETALRAYLQSQVDIPVELAKTTTTATTREKKKRIFSATFLGFGSNNARNLAVSLLVRESGSQMIANRSPQIFYAGSSNSTTLLVEDPCLPVGAHELHQRPLMALLDQTRPIAYDADDDGEPSFSVRLYGGGNFARCQRLLGRLLVAFKRELINCRSSTEPCTTHLLGTGFIPFRVFQFLGLGDFYHTSRLMLEQSGQFRLAPLLRRLASICSLPYHVLLALYPDANRVDGARVRQECFKATWMLALLQVGFRMPFSNDFQTVGELNGQELDWTTGAMLVRLFDRSTASVGST